jgi:hypothetical protein
MISPLSATRVLARLSFYDPVSTIIEKELVMSRGYALLTGLTSVDPRAYNNWDGRNGCWGCELDVDNVRRLLDPLDYQMTILKTEDATGDAIIQQLEKAAKRVQPDDVFLFYFSGHGGQQPDHSGDELDGQDETLVAYDREVIDDELNEVWLKFKTGARLLMLSDSCNSGTNFRLRRNVLRATPVKFSFAGPETRSARPGQTTLRAQMIHLGGCRDGFTSAGYVDGGAFTKALCNAWQDGAFQGNYQTLYRRVVELTGGESQQVQYNEYGPVNEAFRQQRPFEVDWSPRRSDDLRQQFAQLQATIGDLGDRLHKLEQRDEFAETRPLERV